VDTATIIAERYHIERRIARGGQACVYLAKQEHLNRLVALKILTPPPNAEAEEVKSFQERFLLEARTLATLNHPNIVTVYDYGPTNDGSFFIAMEYVRGLRFNKLVEGPMPPARACRLIQQVCEALCYAHRRGVVHRDIKNSNVLVQIEEGQEIVKVVDFGIAKLTNLTSNSNLTRTGMVLGSPRFMAPEQIQSGDVDHRADIYAVGVLLYSALTGQYPFSATNPHQYLYEHLHGQPKPFRELDPPIQIAPDLEGVVLRCLEKLPSNRYQRVEDLIDALDACISKPEPTLHTAAVSAANTSLKLSLRILIPALVLFSVTMMTIAFVGGILLVRYLPGVAPENTSAIIESSSPVVPIQADPAINPQSTPEDVAPSAGGAASSPAQEDDVVEEPSVQAPLEERPPEVQRTSSTSRSRRRSTQRARPTPVEAPPPEPPPTQETEEFTIEQRDIRDPWETE